MVCMGKRGEALHSGSGACVLCSFRQAHAHRGPLGFVCAGTLEKKIYDRQVQKQGLFNRVVETEHTERMFSAKELEDLFRYEVEDGEGGAQLTWWNAPTDPASQTPDVCHMQRPPKSEIEDPSHGSDPVLVQICQNMAGNLSKVGGGAGGFHELLVLVCRW